MPAAYYDIKIEEGSSFKLKLKFKDISNTIVNLNSTTPPSRAPSITAIPVGFEEELTNNTRPGICGVFAKMQVRNSVNASIVELNPIDLTDSGPVSLFGESYNPLGSNAIDLSLSNGKPEGAAVALTTPNIKISLSSFITRRINYGNYLYDLELIFFKLPNEGQTVNFETISNGLDRNIVVFRVLQGRFIVTPAITR
jgi:hypothetical protein